MRVDFGDCKEQKSFFKRSKPPSSTWEDFYAKILDASEKSFSFRAFQHWYARARNPKHSRYPLVRKLQKAAEGAMTGKPLLQGNIVLGVEHETFMGDRRTDVVNLVGGIANVLEGIVYSNDNQIKEIHFKQILSQRDIYKVRIKEL